MSHMFITIKLVVASMMARLNQRFDVKSQKGVSMMEYALIAALISVVAITTLTTLGTNINNIFNNIATKIASAL
jgi:pilus assembly protein Flp/PilA